MTTLHDLKELAAVNRADGQPSILVGMAGLFTGLVALAAIAIVFQ